MNLGEGFAGEGPNAAHVNTMLGTKDGPVGVAWATALATPSAGHTPFVVVVKPNVPVKPMTLFVNKATVDPANDTHARLTWGAAQAGVAAGVTNALRKGVLRAEDADALVLVAAVWVNPAADDEDGGLREQRGGNARRAHRWARRPSDRSAPCSTRASPQNPYFRQ